MRKNNNRKKQHKKYGVFIVDESGIAIRCFNRNGAALNWLNKHYPNLSIQEKYNRLYTFSSYTQVKKFYNKQIHLGCTDFNILALMTYYCGIATKEGFDLNNGRCKRTFENK